MKRRSDIFVFGKVHPCVFEKGTGDGYFPDFPPYQKKIRREERGELIGKNTETAVSPVPRPLLDETDHPHWPRRPRAAHYTDSDVWWDDDDCA